VTKQYRGDWRGNATKYRIRANSLSALRDSLAAARTIFGPALPHEVAAALADAEPHLKKFGITVVQNGHAWHLYEDWPGVDRRRVSGSVWDGRQPLSDAPWVGKPSLRARKLARRCP
jgi:hypothetical protein